MSLKVLITAKDPSAIMAKAQRRLTSVKRAVGPLIMQNLRAVEAGAKNIVWNEAYDTGALYRSISINPKRLAEMSNSLTARVGPDMRIAPYAEFVEFGHFAGFPNRPKVWINGVYYMTRAVAHYRPGIRANFRSGILNAFRYYDKGGVHKYAPEMQITSVSGIKRSAKKRRYESELSKRRTNKRYRVRVRRPRRTAPRRRPRRVYYYSTER